MTDKQALRTVAMLAKELSGISMYSKAIAAINKFHELFTPDVALALLDKLEAAKQDSAKWFKAFEKAVSIGARYEERIAELREWNAGLAQESCIQQQRIAELEARAFNPAILDVIAERQRQQSAEGWTPEHDDEHSGGEMALAASSYALYAHRKPIAPAIPFNCRGNQSGLSNKVLAATW